MDTADVTDETGMFEMEPMNELKIGDGVQLKTILKSLDPENEPTIWYAQVRKTIEPRCEKTGLRGFRPGPTQTGLYNHKRWLEA